MTSAKSNFLGRKKRKKVEAPKPQTLKELCDQRRRELKDENVYVDFVLPSGQRGFASGPTEERVIKALIADFPEAKISSRSEQS